MLRLCALAAALRVRAEERCATQLVATSGQDPYAGALATPEYTRAEWYAGAWLQPLGRFLEEETNGVANIEGAVYAAIGDRPKPVLTRDFFDFAAARAGTQGFEAG
jgi:hypothetical protein